MDSCPKELEPYRKAHELKMREMDYLQYMWWGNYGLSAVFYAVDKSLKGQKSMAEYTRETVLSTQSKTELTEEEKQREVDLFFATENARRINWRRNHKKN